MPLIGARLRELRQNRNLTLKEVADETGLSLSFLSLVERDKVSISIDNLERLAHFYDVRLVHLFAGLEDGSVSIARQALGRIKSQKVEGRRSAFELLSSREGTRMEPLLVKIGPGHGDPHFRTHDGDMLLCVLEGTVRLLSEPGEIHELAAGDVAYYYGFPGRRIENASQTEPAIILLVTAPPTSQRDDALDAKRGVLIQSEEA